MAEPRPIGEILEEILEELRYANRHNKDIEERLSVLEQKDEVLRPFEASRRIGVTSHTLKDWVAKGKIHQVERGGIRGYLLSELIRIKTI